MSNYYAILGVDVNSSLEDISRAYKKLAIKYHPDKTKDPKHHDLFLRIKEAYETLRSQDSRNKYNLQHNLHTPASTLALGSSSTFYSTYTSYDRSTKNMNFAWGQFRSYFSEDLLQKQKQAHKEKIRRDLERKKAQEKADREREALRREMEATKREHLEKLRQVKKEQQQRANSAQNDSSAGESASGSSHELFASQMYGQRKKQAYRAQWSEPLRAYDEDIFGSSKGKPRGDASDPIVIDEDTDTNKHGSSASNTDTNRFGPSLGATSGSNTESYTTEVDEPFVTVESELEPSGREASEPLSTETHAESGLQDQPEQNLEETKNQSEQFPHQNQSEETKNQSEETRNQSEQYSHQNQSEENTHQPEENQNPSHSSTHPREPAEPLEPRKRAKLDPFVFNDLHSSLGPDIGQDDLQDLKNNLPETNEKHTTPEPPSSKKPRLSEFSNGFSKAETLYTPVNKLFSTGYNATPSPTKLTILDFNASSIVHTIEAPRPPSIVVNSSLTKQLWQAYVNMIFDYQRRFTNYKTKIINYQAERTSRDSELQHIYSNDYEAFGVYLKCLEQDAVVLAKFAENVKVFSQVMKEYQQNSSWVESFGILK